MRRSKGLILMTIFLFGVLISGVLWYNGFIGAGKTIPSSDFLGSTNDDPNTGSNDGLNSRVSVLLIGADERSEVTEFNTDSLILASVDPATQRICLLSIPRDTRVFIQGHGYVKINSVATLTNLQTLQKSVEELTGVEITGYIQTNFQGFKQVIDTLGGITVDVEKDMYYETGDIEDGYINLHKGVQLLDGDKTLQYARFRHDALSDISRTARQQVVLKALAKKTFQINTLPKLPFVIPQLMQVVHTDLSPKDTLAIAKVAVGFQSSDVISQTVPGTFQDVEGVSYWRVDPIEVKRVVKDLFQGKTTDKVIDQENVDLLNPIEPTPSKSLPKVPGNSQDPNGQYSLEKKKVTPKR